MREHIAHSDIVHCTEIAPTKPRHITIITITGICNYLQRMCMSELQPYLDFTALTLLQMTTWNKGPHSQNFSKTFSKDLLMPDDLGIPQKFSFPNSRRFFAFPKKFFFFWPVY